MLAALLAVAMAPPAAPRVVELQYLQHSGWVVRTDAHVLVFDYVERTPSGAELPPELRLSPEGFGDRRVVVFVSHGHADHLDPVVGKWAAKRPGIQYVVGTPGSTLPGALVMKPRETWTSGGLTVTATGSTDEGVGFLVSVDGLTLYHAGDHARWSDADEGAFMAEIQWLKERGRPIDVACFPIATGASCEPRPSIWRGVREAAALLVPRVVMPMHVGCTERLDLYGRFRDEVGGQLPATRVVAPARAGDSFRYVGGVIFSP